MDKPVKYYETSDQDGEYVLSEDEIIAEYWDYWSGRMKEVGKEDMISRENCINDWIIVNWAVEVPTWT